MKEGSRGSVYMLLNFLFTDFGSILLNLESPVCLLTVKTQAR